MKKKFITLTLAAMLTLGITAVPSINTSASSKSETSISSSNGSNSAEKNISVDPELIKKVSVENIMKDIKELSTTYKDRFAGSDINNKAGDFLKKRLEDLGCEAFKEEFVAEGVAWNGGNHKGKTVSYNIYGKLKNFDENKKNVILVAHYDSFKGAPGANDNATGTSLLLELADYLSKKELNYNPIILFVSTEELGLFGSRAFAEAHEKDYLPNTEVVINLDMFGKGKTLHMYNTREKFMNGKYPNMAKVIAERLGFKAELKLAPMGGNSDYGPFEDKGVPAVSFGILTDFEGVKDNDYHRPTDVYENLDESTITMVTNIVLNLIENIEIE